MTRPTRTASSPGLVAVLLITRSRPGPRLVYHYPETPHVDAHHHNSGRLGDDETDESDAEDVTTDVDDVAHSGNQKSTSNGNGTTEYVLGHSVDSLEKLLSPGRWSDQKKFQVCVNGLTFLGHPTYALEDGKWVENVQAQQKAQLSPTPAARAMSKYGDYHMYLDPGSLGTTPPQRSHPGTDGHDFTHIPESLDSQIGRSFATSMESGSSTSGVAAEQMTMFQVVFVMRANGMDGQKAVQAVYRDIAKKLSKALHHCQKQSNYVSNESRKLLALKSKAKQLQQDNDTLWTQMLQTSELAWALKEIYERISSDKVAGIRLNGMEMSLMCEYGDRGPSVPLESLSTILLLDTKETLLQELAAHAESSPLAHFIREQTPTKSLQKHSANIGMPLDDILFLCHHLLKWRKARVILPLHQRNVYVVNPDAPVERLAELGATYTKAFPTLPNLPNMLKVLSGKPIKYGNLIPSRDHRGVYIDILAFLVRHDLVVQMKTCGWLRLPKHLASTYPEVDPNKRPLSIRSLLSPHIRAVDDDTSSISSERTAIAAPAQSKRLSTGTSDSDRQENFVIFTRPTEQTEEEVKLIRALLRVIQDHEFRENLGVFLQYLDGESAFEEIAAREGLKRARLEDWLAWLERRGWLIVVRYL